MSRKLYPDARAALELVAHQTLRHAEGLQFGQRAALFVQAPLVEPDQGMQAAAHGQGTFRISANLA